MSNIGVYRITHTASGKVYIGSSSNLKHRIYCHKWDLKRQKHHSLLLQRAWDKYGEEAFVFDVVEHCEREILASKEQHWIDYYGCADPQKGYNRSPTAGTTAGCVKSNETRRRISESKKGTTAWNKGMKGVQKWADDDPRRVNNPGPKKGEKRDPEIGKRISATKKAKGHKPSEAALKASADKRRGKPSHPNQKAALKAKWQDPVWRANVLEKRRLAREAKKRKLRS